MKSQKESYLRVLLVLGVPAIIEQFLMTLVSCFNVYNNGVFIVFRSNFYFVWVVY